MRRKGYLIKNEIDEFEKEKVALSHQLGYEKNKLIKDLKNGLADEIKNNPNKVKIIKKSFFQRIGIFIRKIFTRF